MPPPPEFNPKATRTPLEGEEPLYQDALSQGKVRGRGAQLNPGNRFESVRLHVLGEHLDEQWREREEETGDGGRGIQIKTTPLDDDTRTIINPVDSPDICFKWTVNPYRGCEHGCIYCYARPGHEYLGLSSGLDFETRIFAKPRAPELLRKALKHPRWTGEPIVMSGVTDCYQPMEREREITRACLKVCAEFRQPVGLITKNKLITRDLDILKEMNAWGGVHAAISITSLDNDLAHKMEPRASSPKARLEAVEQLASAGIPVRVMTAPLLPGLNDREVPALLKAAADAGAQGAGYVMLRLPYQIKDLFLDWLRREFPQRAAHVESLVRQMHGGELYSSTWFNRQRGTGPFAQQVGQTFKVFAKRYGLDKDLPKLNTTAFRKDVAEGGQMQLF
ncbi:MAG TPA: PA0069 family radical SAM protein [Phycisphaerales bacterium]|nr:PA0069 family radical SAM protein [Phycisphaerales bacterium]